MVRDYKRYDEYKDSGIDYLKTIPKNWSEMKIKYIAKNNLESFIDGDWIESPYIQDEGIRLIQTGNIGNGKYIEKGDRYISEETFMKLGCTEIFPDDILICRLAEPVGRACLAPKLNNRMITSVDVCRLTPKDKYMKKFIVYYMQMYKYLDYIDSLARGSTRQRISRSQLGEVYITTPSKPEQQIIASFLDKKTAEIDKIINKKETLINHLEEYKKSVITEAVTKGKLGDKYINEDGELVDEIDMKDSGIEWVGEIPEYWKKSKIKYEFENLDHKRIPISSEKRGRMKLKKYDYYGASGVIDKVNDFIYDDELILIGEDGANLLDRNKRLAFIARGKYWVNNHAHILAPKENNIQYMCDMLEIIDYTVYISGSAQPKLTQDNLSSINILKPSVNIQNKIAKHLKKINEDINDLIQKTKQSIEKYKEYKKSLIFEAVTGKIDLRDYELEGGEELAEHNNSSEIERECLSAVD
ncbi:restriction endonuclease subunit S [Halanaerobium saccharolyticum]|uniref:restriction endonuclease subunit S n=1 Tax=Halanaerobium saccharolyticum TaxID=43595 RepID=UPI003FCE06FD